MTVLKRELTGISTGIIICLSSLLLSGFYRVMPATLKSFSDYAFLLVIVFFLARRLYLNYKYTRNGAGYFFIPGINDRFIKVTYLFMGVLLLIADVLWAYWDKSVSVQWVFAGILVSVLLLLNGITALRGGWIRIDGSIVSATGSFTALDVTAVQKIEIADDKIVFIAGQQPIAALNSLLIDCGVARQLQNYLRCNIPTADIVSNIVE